MPATTPIVLNAAAPEPAAPLHDRFRLAMAGGFSGWLRSIITALAGLIATPLLLRFLGTERLGALRTAEQWSGCLDYLNCALLPALGVLLLDAAARGNLGRALGLTKSGVHLLYRQAAVLLLPAALLMAYFMPVLVPVSGSLQGELRIGALIGVATLAVGPLLGYGYLLNMTQRGYLFGLANLGHALITIATSALFAWWGWGLAGQFASAAAGFAAGHLLMRWFALRVLDRFRSATPVPIDKTALRRLRWPMFLNALGGRMNMQTDYLVVAQMVGAAAVTPFMLTQRVVLLFGELFSSIALNSYAALAELRLSGEQVAFQRRLLELVRLLGGVGVVLVATVAAYDRQFLRLWVGANYYGGDALTILTVAQAALFATTRLFTLVIDSQGHAQDRVWMSSAGSVMNLTLSIVLARRFGLWGVTLATVVSVLATDIWYCPLIIARRHEVALAAIGGEALKALALAMPWAIGIWCVAGNQAPIASWIELAVQSGLALCAAAAYSYLVVLPGSQRSAWRARIVRQMQLGKGAH